MGQLAVSTCRSHWCNSSDRPCSASASFCCIPLQTLALPCHLHYTYYTCCGGLMHLLFDTNLASATSLFKVQMKQRFEKIFPNLIFFCLRHNAGRSSKSVYQKRKAVSFVLFIKEGQKGVCVHESVMVLLIGNFSYACWCSMS